MENVNGRIMKKKKFEKKNKKRNKEWKDEKDISINECNFGRWRRKGNQKQTKDRQEETLKVKSSYNKTWRLPESLKHFNNKYWVPSELSNLPTITVLWDTQTVKTN